MQGSVGLSNLSDYRALPKTPYSPDFFTKVYLVIRQITYPMIRLYMFYVIMYFKVQIILNLCVSNLVNYKTIESLRFIIKSNINAHTYVPK